MRKIAFISDYFITDGIGGAELTTDAIMRFGLQKGLKLAPSTAIKLTSKL